MHENQIICMFAASLSRRALFKNETTIERMWVSYMRLGIAVSGVCSHALGGWIKFHLI